MGAPVFGPDGRVAIALFLVGFGHTLSGAAVADHGERLLEATAAVTKSIHGVAP
jgi:DNA-binding IclR family transcriptional regulator